MMDSFTRGHRPARWHTRAALSDTGEMPRDLLPEDRVAPGCRLRVARGWMTMSSCSIAPSLQHRR